ncbi:YqaA family protein [Phyllobacterium sp. OV277]|jgi:membrane protein YqaA with SNARE-associated domain|uniref:YqaA family protein n=1 Tax=Phyllobacterium sp. OV277 TaxID=1882772 RepID=UPI000890BF7E|nr:YqaA family protein [Phyllobacterium sp. OV277]SDN76812.1 membrane protein YqaA, SNARE-associated domain [Phyllobacterium sp. OV277]
MLDFGVYAGLFAAAFAAATILPMQSEALLAGLLLSHSYPASALIAVASVGNVLGSMVNWLLGRGIEQFRNRKWFPASEAQLDRATRWYQRYGKWTLLLSWVPIIGDPLTVIAGVLREPIWSFVLLVAIAKTVRYLVVFALVSGW